MAYTTLRAGSRGDEVKQLQTLLNSNGYNLSIDGIYGNNTAAAVRQYQTAKGLTSDGIVGANTWGALTGGGQAAGGGGVRQSGLSGVSSQTGANLAKYQAGYAPSTAVTEAQQYLQRVTGAAPAPYQSQYGDQLNAIYQKIMGRDPFTYDLNADMLYQQYKDQYTGLGQQAMMDATGQASALSGGYANSYAATVGNQAYQQYLTQLNNKIPELYGLAMDKYQLEGNQMTEQYGLTRDMDDSAYNRYRDTVGDWQSERAYARDTYDAERNFDYGQYGDMLSYWQSQAQAENGDYWTQMEYNLAQQKAASSGGGGGTRKSGATENAGQDMIGDKPADSLDAKVYQIWSNTTGTRDPVGVVSSLSGYTKDQQSYMADVMGALVGQQGADARNQVFSALKDRYKGV